MFIRYIVSLLLVVCILPISVSAETFTRELVVMTPTETLYDGSVIANECADTQYGTSTSPNAFCLIEQVASSSDWTIGTTWYPFGMTLDSINTYAPDFAQSLYWLWFSARQDGAWEPGGGSLNMYFPEQNEKILLAYGVVPLRIEGTTTPTVDATTTYTVTAFDVNAWVWVPVPDSVIPGFEEYGTTSVIGNIDLRFATITPVAMTAVRSGYVSSRPLVVIPVPSITEEIQTITEDIDTSVGSGASVTLPSTMDIARAVNFLVTQQDSDGSFGAPLYTDWVALALSAASPSGMAMENLKQHYIHQEEVGKSLTDIERHAMALMALGIDPRSGTRVNHIAEIERAFDGKQFGDANEYNDDVFAIIVLRKAGYSENHPMMRGARDYILSREGGGGVWSGVDMTAAVIQALLLVEQTDASLQAMGRGIEFLRTSQGVDGGFGNSYATSWVIQAILAYGESPTGWLAGGYHPLQALRFYQNEDGGIGEVSEGKASRIWATAYAIPAAHERTWASLLQDFALPSMPSGHRVIEYSSTTTSESTTTPIVVVSTSTVAFTATTTIDVGDVLGVATSTTEEMVRANTGAPRVATSSRRVIRESARTATVGGKIQLPSEVVATTSRVQTEEPTDVRQITTTKQSLFRRIWIWLGTLFR